MRRNNIYRFRRLKWADPRDTLLRLMTKHERSINPATPAKPPIHRPAMIDAALIAVIVMSSAIIVWYLS